MNKYSIIFITVFSLSTFCASAEAFETNWYTCDSCSTLQKKSQVESNAPNDELSYAYVLDLDNKTITKWTVIVENGFRSAIQTTVDSTANTKFNAYKNVPEDAEMPFTVTATESSSGFGAAFQLVGSPTNLSDLYDWFEVSTFDAFDWDTSYFGSVIATMKWRISDEFDQAIFNFDDGSVLRVNTVDWDWENSELRLAYAYAEDENGDEIPLDPADYDHDDWVNDHLGDYLDNNSYTPFTAGGYTYSFLNGFGNKLIICDRALRTCVLEDN